MEEWGQGDHLGYSIVFVSLGCWQMVSLICSWTKLLTRSSLQFSWEYKLISLPALFTKLSSFIILYKTTPWVFLQIKQDGADDNQWLPMNNT